MRRVHIKDGTRFAYIALYLDNAIHTLARRAHSHQNHSGPGRAQDPGSQSRAGVAQRLRVAGGRATSELRLGPSSGSCAWLSCVVAGKAVMPPAWYTPAARYVLTLSCCTEAPPWGCCACEAFCLPARKTSSLQQEFTPVATPLKHNAQSDTAGWQAPGFAATAAYG